MKKALYAMYAVVFALFAYVQLNDPDPVLWVPLYGMITIFAVFALLDRFYPIPTLIWTLMCLAGALYLSPGVIDWFVNHSVNEIFENMQPGKVFIEEARECFGLLIAAAALWSLYRHGKAAEFKP